MKRTHNSPPRQLAAVGRRMYARGLALGTSGNFSVVVSRRPLRLAITASSVAKGGLRASDILKCDENGLVLGRRAGKPSAETLLHVEVVRRRGAGAVLHTHSVWSTMLSGLAAAPGPTSPASQTSRAGQAGLAIEGYEMLKGLAGVTSHEHREFIPVLDNDQDMTRLARRVGEALDRYPGAHAFLLRRHGLYTWGETLADAERHIEILEFLFETIGRTKASAVTLAGGSSWPS